MTAAENLKMAIRMSGIKQYIIADRAGIDRKQFNSMLNGKKVFKVDYLPDICKALGTSPDKLLGFDGGPAADTDKAG
mgnify:CR=1 FL=1